MWFYPRGLLAGITIMTPNVTECLAFPIVNITGAFHTRCPNCSTNKTKVVESRNVVNFRSATGGIRIGKACGDIFIKRALSIWVLARAVSTKG